MTLFQHVNHLGSVTGLASGSKTVHHPAPHALDVRKEMAALGVASHSYNDLAGNGFCF